MKKWFLAITTAILVAAMSACSITEYLPRPTVATPDETMTPYLEVSPDDLSYSEGYEPVDSTCSYDALPLEGEQKLYEKMLSVCYDIAPEKSEETDRYPMPQVALEGYSLTEAQVRTAMKALTDDHPEIFWLTGTMGYYSDDNTTLIQVYANCSAEDVDTRVNAVRAAANEFYATVPDGLSVFEREILVHDYLIGNIEYDDSVDTDNLDNNDPDIYTVYGAMVNHLAVCEGYARAFKMLMNGLGVECVCITGNSKDEMHMWNAVRIDDSWYNMDVTWDDREESYARYIYFNVNDTFLYEDHYLAPVFTDLSDEEINGVSGDYNASVMNIVVPECTDSTMSYYYLTSPHLSDYEGTQVKSELLSCAEKQEEYFIFYIDETLDYESAVSLLFVEYPQYYFSYVDAVNNTLLDYSIDSSNTGYFTHERSRIVAVEMHYY